MIAHILVIIVYVGGFSSKESNAITSIEFKSLQACEEARVKLGNVSSGMKTVSSVCLKNY